jgi:rSAM/selenodomain-associated transferase 1
MGAGQSCAIAVMAKAPQPGRSKTRLCPPLQPAQAAALSAAFLRDATENIRVAAQTESIAGYVAYAPEGSEGLLLPHLAAGTGLVLADGSPVMPDGVAGFGRSLFHAVTTLFARGHDAVCLLNADGPTLPTRFLCEAAAALARPGDRVVLGAADDGGYYLIGLKAPHAAVFADIAWSTEHVSRQTLQRAEAVGLEVVCLPPWFDVDDVASLERLIAGLGTECSDAVPYTAPATRAWVASSWPGLTPYAPE